MTAGFERFLTRLTDSDSLRKLSARKSKQMNEMDSIPLFTCCRHDGAKMLRIRIPNDRDA